MNQIEEYRRLRHQKFLQETIPTQETPKVNHSEHPLPPKETPPSPNQIIQPQEILPTLPPPVKSPVEQGAFEQKVSDPAEIKSQETITVTDQVPSSEVKVESPTFVERKVLLMEPTTTQVEPKQSPKESEVKTGETKIVPPPTMVPTFIPITQVVNRSENSIPKRVETPKVQVGGGECTGDCCSIIKRRQKDEDRPSFRILRLYKPEILERNK